MKYVMIVQAPSYAIDSNRFAIEGAFAQHLRSMSLVIREEFNQLVLITPQVSRRAYDDVAESLTVIDDRTDAISLIPAEQQDTSLLRYWLRSLPKSLVKIVRLPSDVVVQIDLSTDIRRPTTFLAGLLAKITGRKVVFVVDIDFRLHGERSRRLGVWSRKKYLFNTYVQNNFKILQIRIARRFYDLSLLKSSALVERYANSRGSVHNFFDVVHSSDQVLTTSEATDRDVRLRSSSEALRVCYFGRVVEYKGIDRIIDAVRIANGSAPVALSIIGDGAIVGELRNKVQAAGFEHLVRFEPQVNYGPSLFERLSREDVAIAAPLIEDTPRAAFDAMARGMPIVAFDTSYFKDLAEASGAVLTAEWPKPEALADRLVELARDRGRLAEMASAGLRFAATNTQEHWLNIRLDLVRRLCL